jgi:hypothetical protein
MSDIYLKPPDYRVVGWKLQAAAKKARLRCDFERERQLYIEAGRWLSVARMKEWAFAGRPYPRLGE